MAFVAGCHPTTSSPQSSASAVGQRTSVNGVSCSAEARGPKGMPVLNLTQLPAGAIATLRRILKGGPYPFAEDNTVFDNYQKLLPIEPYGFYREFTVITPGVRNRGTRRVVTGADGEDYYTSNHYASFDWIAC
jgi:ribonuclease T1